MPSISTYDGVFYAPSGLYRTSLQDARSSAQSGARMIKKIGEGAQGECFLMEYYSTRQRFVLKRGSRQDIPFVFKQPVEALILHRVLGRHRRLINLISWELVMSEYDDEPQVMMMYNYYEGGDLSKLIPQHAGTVPEDFIWSVFLQLADALSWLHYGIDSTNPHDIPPRGWGQVVHRDVKPDNVFLSKYPSRHNPYPSVVLGDFGLATIEPVTDRTGDPRYTMPESENTAKGDVYSLGATIYQLAHGRRLGTSRPQRVDQYYSSRLNQIMMACLSTCSKARISSRRLAQYLRQKAPWEEPMSS